MSENLKYMSKSPASEKSKRFEAACAAMQGLMSNPFLERFKDEDVTMLIKHSYKFADELLKQEYESSD